MMPFEVAFKDGKEGLEKIVNLALSGEGEEFILANAAMPSPAKQIRVILRPVKPGGDSYLLAASLSPTEGSQLRVNPSDYAGDFAIGELPAEELRELQGLSPLFATNGPAYRLTRQGESLTAYSSIDLFTELVGKQRRLALLSYCESHDAQVTAMQTITTFAKALETTVNSVYKTAGQPEQPLPEQILVLAAQR